MNIALVWPASTFLIDPMVYPPLGLWYLWTLLERNGHTAEFFDLDVDRIGLETFDQYWVSGTTPQAEAIKQVGLDLKGAGKRSVLGGPHALFHGEEMQEYFDVVVQGEVTTDHDIKDILSTDRHLLRTVARPALGHLPLPVRRVAHRYKAKLKGRPCTTMMTSWGCPYKCAFCSSPDIYGRKVRYVPLESVKEDINICKLYGFGAIQFYDDVLPLKRARTLEIAEHLSRRGMIWRCFMRSDLAVRAGRDFLWQLASLGLVELLVGVESGSQEIKDNVNKGTTPEQDSTLLGWCKELDISFKASVILGLPGETRDTMEETRQWLLDNRPDRADINVLIPMPGTPLFDRAEEFDCRWSVPNPDEVFFKGTPGSLECVVETESLAANEILAFRNDLVAELAIPY